MAKIYSKEELPNDKYHRMKGVSNSMLGKVARSPAHYQASLDKPSASTRDMEIGTAIHTAVLEPERFAAEYIDTGCRLRTHEDYKAYAAVHGGDICLTIDEYRHVKGMANSMHADRYIARLLRHKDAQTEVSVFATDPVTGLDVRCRFDLIIPSYGIAADVKKTQDVRPWAWDKAMHTYGYHRQVAYYSDVWEWATGEKLAAMPLLAVEEDAPHACRAKIVGDESLELGRQQYRKLLNAYADCLHRDKWPGYEYWDADDQGYDISNLPPYGFKEL